MFKFKIGEKVLYKDIVCEVKSRILVETKYSPTVYYKLDICDRNVKETELKQCPKYTITIEDNLGNKRTYHVKEILDVARSTITFTPDKTMIDDVEVDSIIGIKFQ